MSLGRGVFRARPHDGPGQRLAVRGAQLPVNADLLVTNVRVGRVSAAQLIPMRDEGLDIPGQAGDIVACAPPRNN